MNRRLLPALVLPATLLGCPGPELVAELRFEPESRPAPQVVVHEQYARMVPRTVAVLPLRDATRREPAQRLTATGTILERFTFARDPAGLARDALRKALATRFTVVDRDVYLAHSNAVKALGAGARPEEVAGAVGIALGVDAVVSGQVERCQAEAAYAENGRAWVTTEIPEAQLQVVMHDVRTGAVLVQGPLAGRLQQFLEAPVSLTSKDVVRGVDHSAALRGRGVQDRLGYVVEQLALAFVQAAPALAASEREPLPLQAGGRLGAPERAANRPKIVLPPPPAVEWAGSQQSDGRQAVVFCVDRYASAKAWDLTTADQVLERLRRGFEAGLGIATDRVRIVRGEGATKAGLARELRRLGEQLAGSNNLVVIYFYGHGCVQDGLLQLFTYDTELEGQTFSDTISHGDLRTLYGRLLAQVREKRSEVKVVSVIDACRVKTLAPPRPPTYTPIDGVAELFSAKQGQFATEGLFAEAFTEALEEAGRGERSLLGQVFDAARDRVKKGASSDQEPELEGAQRELVLRDTTALGFSVQAWDATGTGGRIERATVSLKGAASAEGGRFSGLRPGVYKVIVRAEGFSPRSVDIELTPTRSGRVLKVPLDPALVLVTGHVVFPDAEKVVVRLGGGRPASAIEGHHVLETEVPGQGTFVLKLPALPASAELLVEAGVVRAKVPVPQAPTEHVGEVPLHDVGRIAPP